MAINTNFPNVRPSLLLDFANSQQLDPRVTFSRSTTAPYYDGKTSVLAEQNLVLQSQFVSGWSTSGGTIVANAVTSPDTTTNAATLTEDTSTGTHRTSQTITLSATGTSYTFSCYVKYSNCQYVRLSNGGATTNANFDLVGGTVTSNTNCTGFITSVGSGWYRVGYSSSNLTSGAIAFFIEMLDSAGTNNSYTGTSRVIQIWGAQLEQRSSATAYNATTTTALTNYIPQLLTAPINAPRFDFNPVTGESLGLLIEQSSTNLQLYSQDFTNAAWTKSNTAITASANIAPDGTQTVQLLAEDTSNTQHRIYSGTTVASGTVTLTIYAKQPSTGAKRYLNLYPSGAGTAGAVFDLALGTITSTIGGQYLSSSITGVGNNTFRCSITLTVTAGSLFFSVYLSNASTSNAPTYTGDGYSGIYIWGAQLEALAFPTSYIATTSAQVTRASDNANMTGTNFSSWYSQGLGSVYCEFNSVRPSASALGIFVISDGTPYNRVLVGNNISGTRSQFTTVANNSGTDLILTATTTVGSYQKVAVSYGGTLISGSNAGSYATSSSLLITVPLNTLGLGYFYPTNPDSNFLNGHIKKFAYYPTQISTSTQLQALTGS